MRDMHSQLRGFGFVNFENVSSIDNVIASKKDEGTFTLNDHHLQVSETSAENLTT